MDLILQNLGALALSTAIVVIISGFWYHKYQKPPRVTHVLLGFIIAFAVQIL